MSGIELRMQVKSNEEQGRITAKMVETAIEPILFSLEDLCNNARTVPTMTTPPWWRWFCNLPTIEERRKAITIDSPDFRDNVLKLVRAERAYAKINRRGRETLDDRPISKKPTRFEAFLSFSEISKEDRKVLASLGDKNSKYSDRPYFALQNFRLASEGLGIEWGHRERKTELDSGMELFSELCSCALNPRLFTLDVRLLENLVDLQKLLWNASLGLCFSKTHVTNKDKSWFLPDNFTLGQFIVWEIEQAIRTSMQFQNQRKQIEVTLHEAESVNAFWIKTSSLKRGEWIVKVIRTMMHRIAEEKLEPIQALRVTVESLSSLDVKNLDQGIMFPLVSLTEGSFGHSLLPVVAELVTQGWRDSFLNEFLDELSVKEETRKGRGKSKKPQKKRSRSQPPPSASAPITSVAVEPTTSNGSGKSLSAKGGENSMKAQQTIGATRAVVVEVEAGTAGGIVEDSTASTVETEEEEKDEDNSRGSFGAASDSGSLPPQPSSSKKLGSRESKKGNNSSPVIAPPATGSSSPVIVAPPATGAQTKSNRNGARDKSLTKSEEDDGGRIKETVESKLLRENVAALSTQIALLTEGMQSFQQVVLQELSQLKTTVTNLQQQIVVLNAASVTSITNNSSGMSKTPAAETPRSPPQSQGQKKAPSSPNPRPVTSSSGGVSNGGPAQLIPASSVATSPGAPSPKSSAVPTSTTTTAPAIGSSLSLSSAPTASGAGSASTSTSTAATKKNAAGRSHYRRASVSGAPYSSPTPSQTSSNSFRLRSATSSPAISSSRLQPQQHQHHPFAGVLYAGYAPQPSSVLPHQQQHQQRLFVPHGLYPPRPASSSSQTISLPQQQQMTGSPSASTTRPVSLGTQQQHHQPQLHNPQYQHHPMATATQFIRPHEWHGSDTLMFPLPGPSGNATYATSSSSSNSAVPASSAFAPPSVNVLLQRALAPSSSLESFETPPNFDYRRATEDMGLSLELVKGIGEFLEHCRSQRLQKAASEQVALRSMRTVVESVWPRARVKGYGSTVTGLSLPESDMDLVVCLPKVTVLQDAIAEEVGPLEGRTADERTSWQQKLAASLIQAPWVDSDSLRTIQHAPIPVITLTTKGKPYFDVPIRLDVSFQSETHHGLATNKLVSALQREHPMLRPMILLLKQFLVDRGLGKGFSGGLSSYALVIMCTCFLNAVARVKASSVASPRNHSMGDGGNPSDANQSSIPQSQAGSLSSNTVVVGVNPSSSPVHDEGNEGDEEAEVDLKELTVLLVWFLRFFGEQFDPRLTGISITRGFFQRLNSHHNNNSVTAGLHAQSRPIASSQSPPQHQEPPAATVQQRRRSFRIEDLQLPPTAHHHHGGGSVGGLHHSPFPGLSPFGSIVTPMHAQDLIPPHKFDPLLIEDPLQPGNNVGRNVFRIHQIQRAAADTVHGLQSSHLVGSSSRSVVSNNNTQVIHYPLGLIITSWRPGSAIASPSSGPQTFAEAVANGLAHHPSDFDSDGIAEPFASIAQHHVGVGAGGRRSVKMVARSNSVV